MDEAVKYLDSLYCRDERFTVLEYIVAVEGIQAAHARIIAERDAWKTLHDAKGSMHPYGYASQGQLKDINEAKRIVKLG